MRQSPVEPPLSGQEDISGRIFTASASMVGICLTSIGLFRISDRLKGIGTLADELLAVDAVGFLMSCLLAYLALKSRDRQWRESIERVADAIFLLGLCLMVMISGLIVAEFV